MSHDASGNVGAVIGSWTKTPPTPRIISVVAVAGGPGASLELSGNGEHIGADAQVEIGASDVVGIATVGGNKA